MIKSKISIFPPNWNQFKFIQNFLKNFSNWDKSIIAAMYWLMVGPYNPRVFTYCIPSFRDLIPLIITSPCLAQIQRESNPRSLELKVHASPLSYPFNHDIGRLRKKSWKNDITFNPLTSSIQLSSRRNWLGVTNGIP